MPFTRATVTYTSTANVSACENCHGKPYRKHGYRMAAVPGLNDFVACKTCHTDQRVGHDQAWQQIADDFPAYAAGNVPDATKYAYTAKLMNDVHMSHSMEFEYPQSMANCATCHAGNLAAITDDTKFTPETCKSCHPVTGNRPSQPIRAPALKDIVAAIPAANAMHATTDFYTATGCNGCHKAGGVAPTFATLHSGYNPTIYAAPGVKWSSAITGSIDSAAVSGNVLNVKFSVTEAAGTGASLVNMMPTLLISLYGHDTKDFIVSAHNRDDLVNRNLEYVVGGAATHPRFTVVSNTTAAESASWEVNVDLSYWSAMRADGSVKRAEIAFLPTVKVGTTTIALNAPSKTFDLVGNAFVASAPIVDAANCNKCHDALATTFHSADRGGNVTVCRSCHTTLNGGAHLEMQSRSIDSYVHAIHSFQAFDIKGYNFGDPQATAMYALKIESTYPNFTLLNCESCHVAGAYNVPNQQFSMPGVLSAASALTNATRNIGVVPSYVTGPGSRACGSCHRARMINEDDAGMLAAFNGHTDTNGYMLDNSSGDPSILSNAIAKIMSYFK